MLDIHAIREQLPITRQRFHVLGQAEPKPLIYLDHGASTHPPKPVLDTYRDFLKRSDANGHRGQHYLPAAFRGPVSTMIRVQPPSIQAATPAALR